MSSGLSWPIGITARGGWRTPGTTAAGPVLHARTGRAASRYGWNLLALCGTSVRPEDHPDYSGTFDPEAKRACRTCAREVGRLEARQRLARQGVEP